VESYQSLLHFKLYLILIIEGEGVFFMYSNKIIRNCMMILIAAVCMFQHTHAATMAMDSVKNVNQKNRYFPFSNAANAVKDSVVGICKTVRHATLGLNSDEKTAEKEKEKKSLIDFIDPARAMGIDDFMCSLSDGVVVNNPEYEAIQKNQNLSYDEKTVATNKLMYRRIAKIKQTDIKGAIMLNIGRLETLMKENIPAGSLSEKMQFALRIFENVQTMATTAKESEKLPPNLYWGPIDIWRQLIVAWYVVQAFCKDFSPQFDCLNNLTRQMIEAINTYITIMEEETVSLQSQLEYQSHDQTIRKDALKKMAEVIKENLNTTIEKLCVKLAQVQPFSTDAGKKAANLNLTFHLHHWIAKSMDNNE
jgi:hypothetical protein